MSLLNSDVDWAYPTLPNNQSCLSSLGEQCRFSRGFCLGGSTSINYMLYIRGNHRDFDDWDIPSWTWDDLKPYFLKYEGLQDLDKLPTSSIPYHNTSGILKVEFFGDSGNSWHKRLFSGLEDLGFPYNPDANGVSQVGVTESIGYVYDGERMSTARAYLTNNEIKSKLKVAKNAQCTGVILNEQNVATGVNVTIKSLIIKRNIQLYVRKEVILSAGTVGTPQILMLSGIGPAEHLEEMGIEVKADLPVGDNMSDHVLALVLMKVNRGYPAAVATVRSYGMVAADAAAWLATRQGPLKTIDTVSILTIYNSTCYDFDAGLYDGTGENCDLPTTQFINTYIDNGLLPPIKPLVQQTIGLNDEVFDQISDANKNNALLVFSPIVLRPYSRGNIRLASTDGLKKPAIYANYLADERDVDEIVKSIYVIEDLVKTKSFSNNNASILHIKIGDCPLYEDDPTGYWYCYVRHMTYSVYHAVGTAALGTCVDETLRVRGVTGLRVADLSVAPLLPRGNTEALAVAIGERLADFIAKGKSRKLETAVNTGFYLIREDCNYR